MSGQHYFPKNVSQVTPNDYRVCLIGNVVATTGVSFILDDGTGKIEIYTDRQIPKNKTMRVFCSIEGEKLKADVVQDLENFDLNLFKKVKELYNSAGV